jgi:hypothetical protein
VRLRLGPPRSQLSRCWVLPNVHPEGSPPRPPELPADLFLLEDLVKSKRAALVVIDPLMAFLSGQVDSHRDQDVRRVLASLAYMASRTGAAVVIVRHMNKGTGSALYRGSGAIGIVGAARAGLLVAPDPDDEGRRILAIPSRTWPRRPTRSPTGSSRTSCTASPGWSGTGAVPAPRTTWCVPGSTRTRRPPWPRRCGS